MTLEIVEGRKWAKLLALLSLNLPNIGTRLQPHGSRSYPNFSLILSPSKTGSPMGRLSTHKQSGSLGSE